MLALIKSINGLYKIVQEKDISNRLSSGDCLVNNKSGETEKAEILTITRRKEDLIPILRNLNIGSPEIILDKSACEATVNFKKSFDDKNKETFQKNPARKMKKPFRRKLVFSPRKCQIYVPRRKKQSQKNVNTKIDKEIAHLNSQCKPLVVLQKLNDLCSSVVENGTQVTLGDTKTAIIGKKRTDADLVDENQNAVTTLGTSSSIKQSPTKVLSEAKNVIVKNETTELKTQSTSPVVLQNYANCSVIDNKTPDTASGNLHMNDNDFNGSKIDNHSTDCESLVTNEEIFQSLSTPDAEKQNRIESPNKTEVDTFDNGTFQQNLPRSSLAVSKTIDDSNIVLENSHLNQDVNLPLPSSAKVKQDTFKVKSNDVLNDSNVLSLNNLLQTTQDNVQPRSAQENGSKVDSNYTELNIPVIESNDTKAGWSDFQLIVFKENNEKNLKTSIENLNSQKADFKNQIESQLRNLDNDSNNTVIFPLYSNDNNVTEQKVNCNFVNISSDEISELLINNQATCSKLGNPEADFNLELESNEIGSDESEIVLAVFKEASTCQDFDATRPRIISDCGIDPSLTNSLLDRTLNPIEEGTSVKKMSNLDHCEDSADDNEADPDYIESSEDSDSDITDNENETSKTGDSEIKEPNTSAINVSTEITFEEGKSSGYDTNMFVTSCDESSRRNACLFCFQKCTQISKHLQRIHKNEKRVEELQNKSPKEKKKLLCALRKEGNAAFNKNPEKNNGELIVTRRPKANLKKVAKDYLPCAICKSTFSKKSLRKHFKKCSKRTNKQKIVLALGRLEADRIEPHATMRVRKELCFLRDDEVGQTVRQDGLIIEWANYLCTKYRQNQEQSMIRNRLRLIARLLIAIKELVPDVSELMDVYDVQLYDALIEGVQKVAKYNPETDMFDAPANGSQLGTFIKDVGKRLESVCIRKGLKERKEKVKEFLTYHDNEFSIRINRTVAESQLLHKLSKKTQLPTDEDIRTLYNYLEDNRLSAFNKLKENFSIKEWRKLAEMTLLLLLVFNRRRPGELERIKISDFENKQSMKSDSNKQVYKSLSKSGKQAVDRYQRVEIRGKKMRIVPVLFTDVIIESVKIILQMRAQAKVSSNNPYVFGIYSYNASRIKYIRGCDVMREASKACGAKEPHLLRATTLRKHVATKCFSLQIKDHQVNDLANFLGHESEIHKKIYRQPIPELEIAKVAGLLENALGESDDESSEEDNEEEEENSNQSAPKENIFLKSKETTTQSSNKRVSSRKRCLSSDVEDFDLIDRKKNKKSEERMKSPSSPRGMVKRTSWGAEEAEVVRSIFNPFFTTKLTTGPSCKDVQIAIKQNHVLRSRTIAQVKTYINNHQKKIKKSNSLIK